MEEMSSGGALGSLFAAPFTWWQNRARKRRLLSTHELSLRRATHPLGLVAVLGWAVWLVGVPTIRSALAPVLRDPSVNWLPLALLAAGLLYVLVSLIVGLSGCRGVRSDPMLPMWACVQLALGGGGLALLMSGAVLRARSNVPDFWMAGSCLLLSFAAVWCIAVGGARLVLLTLGGGNALRTIQRGINRKNAALRPARRHWWQWW